MDSFFENAEGILSSASESTLGILGLMILCLSVLTLFFFHAEEWKVKGAVFLVLFVGAFTFGYAIILDKNPIRVSPNLRKC